MIILLILEGAVGPQLNSIIIHMKQLTLKNITLALSKEDDNIRVKSPDKNVLLLSQNIKNVIPIIESNFSVVDSFYLKRIADNPAATFDPDDIHRVSVSIVLDYLYMYNLWRLQYQRKKYQDLSFKQEDFDHPSTNDTIFSYFKYKYPDDWEIKCCVLMGRELDDLKRYYERRVQYYNK